MDSHQEIIPHLFLGGSNYDSEYLKARHITVVISLGDNYTIIPNITHIIIPCEDDSQTNVIAKLLPFQNLLRFSIEAEQNVLVHCGLGISRSPTFVIGFLMVHEKITSKAAILRVQQLRPRIEPNKAFLAQLKQLDDAIAFADKIEADAKSIRSTFYALCSSLFSS